MNATRAIGIQKGGKLFFLALRWTGFGKVPASGIRNQDTGNK